MNIKLLLRYVVTLTCMAVGSVQAHFHHPLYDILLQPESDSNHNIFMMNAFGVKKAEGYALHGHRDNVFTLWSATESTLNMLQGFDPTSAIGQLATLVNATDDGTRGHVLLNGDLKMPFAGLIGGWFRVAEHVRLIAYLPWYHTTLENFTITDLTASNNAQDARTKQYLTNNLAAVVFQLGDGLSLQNWKRTGIGDAVIYTQYERHFPQDKPFLKDVYLNGRLGLSLPTGKRIDEDKLFADSFGNDGSVAIPFAGGIELQLGAYFKTGLDIELTHIFSSNRNRRIKTSKDQTEFLLLEKIAANKDYGMDQQFDLYIESFDLPSGLACTLTYQYFKHGDDQLSLKTNTFSSSVANTAFTLEDYTAHQILINVAYDFAALMPEYSRAIPQVALLARIPFNGKNVALTKMVGFTISVDF
jgi:hypothetical protein